MCVCVFISVHQSNDHSDDVEPPIICFLEYLFARVFLLETKIWVGYEHSQTIIIIPFEYFSSYDAQVLLMSLFR